MLDGSRSRKANIVMSETPRFFLPASSPETAEDDFAQLADFARTRVPDHSQRTYSITFLHNGVEWTATVGKSLRGIPSLNSRSSGGRSGNGAPVSDPAIVLAIFPGDPYLVVTNDLFVGNTASRLANPFMAGRPLSITRFEC